MLKDASITVRIKPSTRQRIDALATSQKRTRSYLVEEALERYLDSSGNDAQETLTVADPHAGYDAFPEGGDALTADNGNIAAKLRSMEILWEELSRTAEEQTVPPWHAEVLAARDRDVAEGSGQFVEWETARATIRAVLK